MIKASDNPKFCTSCHNMQSYYDSWNDSKLLANKHAKADVKCHDCHEATIAQQTEEGIKYITGNFETPLKKREFDNAFCTRCHKFDEVKAKTNFVDAKGVASNPHDNHNGDQNCNKCHNMHQKSNLMCDKCHSFSWQKKLPEYWK